MMMDVRFRNMVPAVIHRLDRCSEADAAAINQLFSAFFAPQDLSKNEMLRQWGWILGDHIVFSELWETPAPPPEVLDSIRENAVASREITAGRAQRQAAWPTYKLDALAGQWAETQVPMLMLQGGLDPATPAAAASKVGEHFSGENQHYVFFPEATHTTMTSTATTKKRSCATMTMMNFIENPTGPLDTSCLGELVPLSFATSTYAGPLLGRADLWEE
jgi:pimeloyl-ACP methyl ester carboxylesterase